MPDQRSTEGRRREEREQAWRQIFAEQAKDGLSVAKFCRQRGITASSFYFWRGEVARHDAERRTAGEAMEKAASPTMSFVEVGIARGDEEHPGQPTPIVIQLGRVRVEVPSGFDRDTLAQVLAILQ